ncbi:MAG: hypothetical protein KKB31_06280 [Nanoarchaeota archaeon]|nr:hypothetical protein [Nanoarchaeota archaeon]
MKIKDVERTERVRGEASFVTGEFALVYAEKVEKFISDHKKTMGDKWVKSAGSRLYNFQGRSGEGYILGSSTDMGVALATFCPEIPLITGEQLLNLYKQAGNKNPFGIVYIDFGIQINGQPNTNREQARILLDDFKKRGIKIGEGRVPNFNQLRLQADKGAGLVYRLADDVKETVSVSDYPFRSVGKNGLFGAYLGTLGIWDAYSNYLDDSDEDGRVVRYDAEGAAPKKLEGTTPKPKDLSETLKQEFLKKF